MTLRFYLQHTNSIVIHIGTTYGEGWLYSGEAQSLLKTVAETFLNREVSEMYIHDGREEDKKLNCCELKAGIAVIIKGKENGSI